MNERMFDKDSFLDEIKTPEEAKQCVEYLAANEWNFRKQLAEEGLSYDDIQKEVATVWRNLAKSCARVGYSDSWLVAKVKQLGASKS